MSQTATFAYLPLELPPNDPYPSGRTILRPYLFAVIRAATGLELRFIVSPDSGADCCMFPLKWAYQLNLNPESMPMALTAGIGNQANLTYYDHVTVDLGQGVVFEAYAGFTPALDARGSGLLGQSGLFSNFDVHFLYQQGIFTIETP